MLVRGINAFSSQWSCYIFIFYHTYLNLAFLLHKAVLVTFMLVSTVHRQTAGQTNKRTRQYKTLHEALAMFLTMLLIEAEKRQSVF